MAISPTLPGSATFDPRLVAFAEQKHIPPAVLQQAMEAQGLDLETFLKHAGAAAGTVLREGHVRHAHGPGSARMAELPGRIKKAQAAQEMSIGTVGSIPVTVTIGYLERTPADALVAPQWPGDAESYDGGVGKAITRAGGGKARADYEQHCATHQTRHRDVHISPSGVELWPHVINAVTVSSGAAEEFDVVRDTTFYILAEAAKAGLRTVALPALGTGVIGRLTPEQSAQAMVGGIARASEAGLDVEVALVMWAGSMNAARLGFDAFTDALTKPVANAQSQVGEKKFDLAAWLADNRDRLA